MADSKDDLNWSELKPQLIKMALELGPLVVFFIVNARADIFVGTAWFMGAMVLSLALSWLLLKRVALMPLVTGVVVLVFGGLTLWLHDDTFIKMKPTVINALFTQNNAESLVAIARKETDPAAKREIVSKLSLMTKSKVAMDYLMEILNK